MTQKQTKNKKEYVIENKIEYNTEFLHMVKIPKDFKVKVKDGDKIKKGNTIAKYEMAKIYETIDIIGEPLVRLNQEIKKGDVIAQKGKIFKKKTKSQLNGVVKEISNNYIKLLVKPDENQDKKEVKSPVDCTVENVYYGYLTIKFPALVVNLFQSKGTSSWGNLIYISSETFKDKKNLPNDLKDKIIVTDYLTSEMYPVAVSLGCTGIIANSMEYEVYKNIVLLSVPIGVHSGFGAKYQFAEDIPFVSFVRENKNSKAYLDTKYNRLVICSEKRPKFLPAYEFNLKHIGVVI